MALDLPEQICGCGCGKTFTPKRRKQRFATRLCRYKHHNRQGHPVKTCPHCGSRFRPLKEKRVD